MIYLIHMMDMIGGTGSRGDLRLQEAGEPESELLGRLPVDVAFFTNSLKFRRYLMRKECSGVEGLFVMHSNFQWEALVGN